MNKGKVNQENRQFLNEMEINRRAKPCKKKIDLRKKVLGECREYSLGGVKHYLNDRSYLLLKRLISANDQQYSEGIYEDFVSTLEKIKPSDHETSQKQSSITLVKRSRKQGPELFPFDHLIQRKCERIALVTKVEVKIGDIIYSGSTIDISKNAIKIVVQKAYCLAPMQQVQISFNELFDKHKHHFLLTIPYRILHISHPQNVTHIVVERCGGTDNFNQWFDIWFDQAKQLNQRQVNINDKIYNQLLNQYMALYCDNLKRAVFFLSHGCLQESFISSVALGQFTFADRLGKTKIMWVNDFTKLFPKNNASGMALIFSWMENDIYTFSSQRVNHIPFANVVAWLQTKPQWRIYLAASHQICKPVEDETDEIRSQANEIVAAEADELMQLGSLWTTHCSLLDISAVFENIDWSGTQLSDCSTIGEKVASIKHSYTDTVSHCHRKEPRILAEGRVQIYPHDGINVTGEIVDFSISGLKVAITANIIPFAPGSQIEIEFIDWTKKIEKKKVKIPYDILKINHHQGSFILKLHRDKLNTTLKQEQWLVKQFNLLNRIAKPCLDNYRQHFRFAWFSNLIAKNITSLPFFIGLDEQGSHIVQAIGVSSLNKKIRDFFYTEDATFEWDALQLLAEDLTQALTACHTEKTIKAAQLSMGIYCFVDENGHWQANTDFQLATAKQKKDFIVQAMKSHKYRFYHCSLAQLRTQNNTQIDATVEYAASYSLKKAKEVRILFNSLLAVGELTNTTKIIAHIYQQI